MEGKFFFFVSMQFFPYFETLADCMKFGRGEVQKILYLIERL
jgi:hypothetical protein